MYIIVVTFKINIIQPFSVSSEITNNIPAAVFLCFNRGHVPHRGGTPTQSLDAEDKNLAEFSSKMEGEKRNFIVDYHSYYSDSKDGSIG